MLTRQLYGWKMVQQNKVLEEQRQVGDFDPKQTATINRVCSWKSPTSIIHLQLEEEIWIDFEQGLSRPSSFADAEIAFFFC